MLRAARIQGIGSRKLRCPELCGGVTLPVGRANPTPDRPVAVWRTWRRAERGVFLARWWRHWRLGDGAFFIQMGCAFGMIGCEVAFWPAWIRDPLAAAFQPLVSVLGTETLAWSLGLLAAGNAAWTLQILLRRRTLAARAGALTALTLLSAPPFLGLLAIPLWRRLEGERPAWLRAGGKGTGTGAPAALPVSARGGLFGSTRAAASAARTLARRLEATWIAILWLGPGNLAWVMVATAWLVATSRRPVLPSGALLVMAGALHLLAFATARVAAPEPQLLEPSLRRRRRLELLWLLPSPLPQLWFFVLLKAGLNPRRDASLAHAALLGRGFRGSPAGAHLAGRARAAWSGRTVWQRWRRPAGAGGEPALDAATLRFLAVARWKTAGLAVDGFAVAAGAAANGLLPRSPDQPLPGWVWAFFASAVGLIGLTVLAWGGQQVARRLGVGGFAATLDRMPYLRTVALGQLALALGFLWGVAVGGGGRVLILALANGWALAVILLVMGTFLNPARQPGTGRRDPRDPWAWLLLFTALPLLLLGVAWAGARLGSRAALVGLSLAASLAWGGVALRAGGSALCHPLEPGQLGEASTPAGVRIALRFILITAALPLGGLLVPAWMAVRERCRPAMDTLAATASREVPCSA